MLEAVRPWVAVIMVTVATCPVAALVVVAVAARRTRAGQRPGRAFATAGAEVGIVVGTLPWVWMVLTPGTGSDGVELVPGRGLADVLGSGWPSAVVQVGGNLLVFAMFGLLAPVRWGMGVLTVAGYAVAGSAMLEALQYGLGLGRVSSVDDVALNTLGAVLAALISRPWWRERVDQAPARPSAMPPPG
jgi:hypothetical protein